MIGALGPLCSEGSGLIGGLMCGHCVVAPCWSSFKVSCFPFRF